MDAAPTPGPVAPDQLMQSTSVGAAAAKLRGSPASPVRYLLPKNLACALTHLADSEIEVLLAAVMAEAKRRNPLPASQLGRESLIDEVGGLTTGQRNAVSAAFKAGVKPSAIARQFGISAADVKKALAARHV